MIGTRTTPYCCKIPAFIWDPAFNKSFTVCWNLPVLYSGDTDGGRYRVWSESHRCPRRHW